MIIHKPVLLKESIENLNLKEGSVVVDATLGGGGHSNEILQKIGKSGKLIVIDQDSQAVENFSKQLPVGIDNVITVKDNFANLENILAKLNPSVGGEKVDAILADLGYSSIQLEDAEIGMSFLQDAPLDMRLDRDGELTAKQIVNEYSQGEISRVIKDYGEERFASIIAKKIADRRKIKLIETTGELVEIIRSAVPERHQHRQNSCLPAGRHPATKTFQALRIETNKELEVLKNFVPQAIDALNPGGRLAIISFHSLEDRIVKNIYRENARGCICPTDFPVCRCGEKARVKIISKKPIIPSQEEILDNPRSRSAKLRIIEKI